MSNEDFFSFTDEQISKIQEANPEIHIDHAAYLISKILGFNKITKDAVNNAVEQFCMRGQQLISN